MRTILKGRIVSEDRREIRECAVRDLSDTGAQIVLKQPSQLAREIEFEIPQKNMAVRARVIWSDGLRHGVMFVAQSQQVENVACALYDAEGDGVCWEREPEILKEEFRSYARKAIAMLEEAHVKAAVAA